MTKFCMSVDIHDIIKCATFCDDLLRGLGVAMGRISRFPIDLRRRPYNTLALPCECVIILLCCQKYCSSTGKDKRKLVNELESTAGKKNVYRVAKQVAKYRQDVVVVNYVRNANGSLKSAGRK